MVIHPKAPVIEASSYERASGGEALPVISLADVLRVIRTRKLTIFGTAVVIVAVTALVVSQMTPLYHATAYVMLDKQESNVTDAKAVVTDLPTDPASIENQVQILRSRELIGAVVDKLNLIDDPEFDPNREPEPSAIAKWLDVGTWLPPQHQGWLDPEYWLGANASPYLDWLGGGTSTIEEPPGVTLDPREALISRVLGHIGVEAQGRSTAIAVTFESEVPEKSAIMANTIATTYVEQQLKTKFVATEKASEWLTERLQQLSQQTEDSERMVQLYKARSNLTDAATPGIAPGTTIIQQQLSALNLQLITAQSDLAQQEARFNQVAAMKQAGNSADVSQVVSSPLISQLRQQEVEILREEAELSSKYGPLHPRIQDLDSQKSNLFTKIDEEVRRIVETVQNDVEVARARVRALQKGVDDLTDKAQDESMARVKLSELTASAASNRTMFEAFLNRFNEIEGQDAIQLPDARVISSATVPGSPTFPDPLMFYGAAVPGGLVLGLLLAMLFDSMAVGFRTQQQVESVLSLPVLAVLPEVTGSSRTRRQAADRVVNKPMSAFAEAVRGLQLGLVLAERPPKVVVVTSSVPSEGKTTVAVSLARLAARSVRRVILVDADMRQPSVAKAIKLSQPQPGIVEALTGTPIEDCLCKDPMSDALVLPGRRLANPSDILGSGQMTKLISALSESCDLLIIDTPPLLATNDARILAQFADSVLLAVRWERTPRDAAIHALRSLSDVMAPTAGVVLTRTDWEQFQYYNYGRPKYLKLSKYYQE